MKLVDVEVVAEMLGVSTRTVSRFRDSGRIPKAVTIGRCVRWRQCDIEQWIEAGCPDVRRTNWVC
jgi:excisionase family DNA binding protein